MSRAKMEKIQVSLTKEASKQPTEEAEYSFHPSCNVKFERGCSHSQSEG